MLRWNDIVDVRIAVANARAGLEIWGGDDRLIGVCETLLATLDDLGFDGLTDFEDPEDVKQDRDNAEAEAAKVAAERDAAEDRLREIAHAVENLDGDDYRHVEIGHSLEADDEFRAIIKALADWGYL
jgi:hypothetical protein